MCLSGRGWFGRSYFSSPQDLQFHRLSMIETRTACKPQPWSCSSIPHCPNTRKHPQSRALAFASLTKERGTGGENLSQKSYNHLDIFKTNKHIFKPINSFFFITETLPFRNKNVYANECAALPSGHRSLL